MPEKESITSPNLSTLSEAMLSTVVISNTGDVLIQIKNSTATFDRYYRCSRSVLRGASNYFNVLLDPYKFGEGIAVEAKLQKLKRQYKNSASIPASDLPKATVTDVGGLPTGCISTSTVIALFFQILHDSSTQWPVLRAESVNLIALLSILADRFSCSRIIAEYVIKHKLKTTLLKDRRSATAHQREVDNRQKLLAGLFLGFADWVYQSSATLIVEGPIRQTAINPDNSEDEDREGEDALWWNLPSGVEEELACRREYVLDTLSSIQKHFVNLYISRERQCRLGYNSSPQCDSYQLGEMIRFFSRKGTLRIESVFDPAPQEPEPYNGNLDDVIAKFKQCPSYQIDVNHTHCGLRTRLLSILEGPRSPRPRLQVGICLECWKEDKRKESWLENPKEGTWVNAGESFCGRGCKDHRDTKAMYTAVKRDWTPVCAV